MWYVPVEGEEISMDSEIPNFANLQSMSGLESLYRSYRENPKNVEPSWRYFFQGLELGSLQSLQQPKEGPGLNFYQSFQLIDQYRRFGHLKVPLNPIQLDPIPEVEELKMDRLQLTEKDLESDFPTCGLLKEKTAPLKKLIEKLENTYCQSIGFEYMDVNAQIRTWIQQQIETKTFQDLSKEEVWHTFKILARAEHFENFIHTKYVGQKRFSIEGAETFIPILDEFLQEGGKLGMQEYIIGMAHRGRLNVLGNVLKKPYSILFYEFEEDYEAVDKDETGDVKYHKGYTQDIKVQDQMIHLNLCANPSHLESVIPVALGQTKAKQVLKHEGKTEQIASILVHGDASFAGQGVVYESMQLWNLEGYTTGGSLHVVINNHIGFTTPEHQARSTKYCTDIAKCFGAPVFHVNAEDPVSCVWAAKLAVQIRNQFHCDVIIDLNGYRKYGHNEGDEPAFTQPREYEKIRKHPSILQIFQKHLIDKYQYKQEDMDRYVEEFKAYLQKEQEMGKTYSKKPPEPSLSVGSVWGKLKTPKEKTLFDPVDTKISVQELERFCGKVSEIPENFSLHPKLKKWIENRHATMQAKPEDLCIDWGLAEHLAYAALLVKNKHIRLSGQDSQRGTFNHRHAVWFDTKNAKTYVPLNHLQDGQARLTVLNSPLSEFAVLGFEYGYSLSYPDSLIMWEAQFGDFVNGAQIIIDQYITSAEQKWGRKSGLTLLLPHAQEGQGPEHSSARLERFLELSAMQNMQVVYPTTPSQYYHLLMRQGLRELKRPLIIMTPKSLLRLAECKSSFKELSEGSFQEILEDASKHAKRILFCTGKIYYDLMKEKQKQKKEEIVLIRIEQLYPLDETKLKSLIQKYTNVEEWFWVQEEMENMGAWRFIRPQIEKCLSNKSLRYIGQSENPSPALGFPKTFKQEYQRILQDAMGIRS